MSEMVQYSHVPSSKYGPDEQKSVTTTCWEGDGQLFQNGVLHAEGAWRLCRRWWRMWGRCLEVVPKVVEVVLKVLRGCTEGGELGGSAEGTGGCGGDRAEGA